MGKPKHSNDTRGEQKGAQQHDEGQYGPKAFEAKWSEITDHSGATRKTTSGGRTLDTGMGARSSEEVHEQELRDPSVRDGRHRLSEERKQHDEADRAQAKNHLISDIEVHGHERGDFQVPHGRTRHPADAEGSNPAIHSPGESGK